ncbi:MAG TPA: peptidase U32 family protein [Niabella sp.]|nr:peptidase U32 family protein [Niabella sp.]HOZ96112.1 peptidase U32 family protein [Niabella sp.]HQW13478.1 peptidase U32 family protein [Niabella sp.]HQX18872.1 peptidase U32 family protein [Niabella sp.]HQX41550.1 peptidase U32 family protein [Niabella sp.]
MPKKVSLLSPAGSFDSLQAAINAGADAIYFGVEQLNMRTCSSHPFTLKDIAEVAATCKDHGVKSSITLNTVMYEHDRRLLQEILAEVKAHQIDSVIASDFAVIEQCRSLGIPLHVSTQANVSNLDSVKFFANFSDVIVLARELTLKQVEHITREIIRQDIRGISGHLMQIEIFGHGALCMAISGKCYLSLHEQNASANRGACTQNCRRSYEVTDTETGNQLLIENEYIMSPKDLCTLPFLDEVVDSGIDILKIEGRSKGADYVHVVTKCYRDALDDIEAGTFTLEKIHEYIDHLSSVYNRGFWDGYYLGRKLGEWTKNPGSIAKDKKIYLGKATKYYPKIGVGEFLIETGKIKVGDTLLVSGAKLGVQKEKFETLRVNGVEQVEAGKGDKITFPVAAKLTPQDKLYKIVSTTDE